MRKLLAILLILSISSVDLFALEIDKDSFFGNTILQFDFTGIASEWTDAGYGWHQLPTIQVTVTARDSSGSDKFWNLGYGGSGNWDPSSGLNGTFTYSYDYSNLDYTYPYFLDPSSDSIDISFVFVNYGYSGTSVPVYLDNFWLRGPASMHPLTYPISHPDTPDIQIESWEDYINPLDGWAFNSPSSASISPIGATDGSYALRLAVPTDTFWHEGMSFEFIPEPATIALLGLGGLALRRRKK